MMKYGQETKVGEYVDLKLRDLNFQSQFVSNFLGHLSPSLYLF